MNKDEFLEKALQANQDAVKEAKLSDITDKDSSFYKSETITKPAHIEQNNQKASDELPRIRTFSADVTDAVDGNQLSVSKIALAEASKKNEAGTEESPKQEKNWFTIISISLGSMLMLGGIGAIGFVWYQKNYTTTPIQEMSAEKEIIRFEDKKDVPIKNISRELITEEIAKEKKNPLSQNGIRKLNFFSENDLEKTKLKINNFFEIIEARIPDELLRNLGDEFFVGIYFDKGEPHPLLLLQGPNFETIFPGMFNYEIEIQNDLTPIFGQQKTQPFEDAIILNKDVRAITDKNQNPTFFYSIVDNRYIVIVDHIKAFEEVLKRLREQK